MRLQNKIRSSQLRSVELNQSFDLGKFPSAKLVENVCEGLSTVALSGEALAIGKSGLELTARPASGLYLEQKPIAENRFRSNSSSGFCALLPEFLATHIHTNGTRALLATYLNERTNSIQKSLKDYSCVELEFELRRTAVFDSFSDWHVDGEKLAKDHLLATYIETLLFDVHYVEGTNPIVQRENGTVYIPEDSVIRSKVIKLWEATGGSTYLPLLERVDKAINKKVNEHLAGHSLIEPVDLSVGNWGVFPGGAYRGLVHRSALPSHGVANLERLVFLSRMKLSL